MKNYLLLFVLFCASWANAQIASFETVFNGETVTIESEFNCNELMSQWQGLIPEINQYNQDYPESYEGLNFCQIVAMTLWIGDYLEGLYESEVLDGSWFYIYEAGNDTIAVDSFWVEFNPTTELDTIAVDSSLTGFLQPCPETIDSLTFVAIDSFYQATPWLDQNENDCTRWLTWNFVEQAGILGDTLCVRLDTLFSQDSLWNAEYNSFLDTLAVDSLLQLSLIDTSQCAKKLAFYKLVALSALADSTLFVFANYLEIDSLGTRPVIDSLFANCLPSLVNFWRFTERANKCDNVVIAETPLFPILGINGFSGLGEYVVSDHGSNFASMGLSYNLGSRNKNLLSAKVTLGGNLVFNRDRSNIHEHMDAALSEVTFRSVAEQLLPVSSAPRGEEVNSFGLMAQVNIHVSAVRNRNGAELIGMSTEYRRNFHSSGSEVQNFGYLNGQLDFNLLPLFGIKACGWIIQFGLGMDFVQTDQDGQSWGGGFAKNDKGLTRPLFHSAESKAFGRNTMFTSLTVAHSF